jgi:hypothetical protein
MCNLWPHLQLVEGGQYLVELEQLYQILTAFNKFKIMSETVLLLPNTDRLQQVEDYVRGYRSRTASDIIFNLLKMVSIW